MLCSMVLCFLDVRHAQVYIFPVGILRHQSRILLNYFRDSLPKLYLCVGLVQIDQPYMLLICGRLQTPSSRMGHCGL